MNSKIHEMFIQSNTTKNIQTNTRIAISVLFVPYHLLLTMMTPMLSKSIFLIRLALSIWHFLPFRTPPFTRVLSVAMWVSSTCCVPRDGEMFQVSPAQRLQAHERRRSDIDDLCHLRRKHRNHSYRRRATFTAPFVITAEVSLTGSLPTTTAIT